MLKRIPIATSAVWLMIWSLVWVQPAAASTAVDASSLSAKQTEILLELIAQADDQGFRPDEFKLGDAAAWLQSADPGERRQGEERLRAAAVAYASAQHGGRLPPDRFLRDWAIRPAAYDARSAFVTALSSDNLIPWAASLPPPDERYGRLVQALARYTGVAARGGWPELPIGPALKLGATGERVAALRRRLGVEDPSVSAPKPANSGGATQSDIYDATLAAAVARAEARYGLGQDGVAGANILRALNVPVEERLEQIRANLERWRWAPRNLPSYRVELNIADARLELFDRGKAAMDMRAIVGRAAKPTPMFQDQIRAVVFNPPWNVPADIAAKEIWPKIRRDPRYMARERFVVRPGGGLQQLPGPKCALGAIKFDLSNSFGVYLHDTPARSLFARDSRTLSHGCMRVEKPNALAKRVLQGDPNWSETKIDLTIFSGKTVRAPLRQPAPVYVFYWTAFVDEEGHIEFRSDVYHWDRKLLDAL